MQESLSLISAQEKHFIVSNPSGDDLSGRFDPPDGFVRIHCEDSSFAAWLRRLPLKPEGSKVRYFDGREKSKTSVYAAVVDLEIGDKNLHQCADAVIRLKAEYLYSQKRYAEINFHFTNGFPAQYSEWIKGNRIVVSGNEVRWVKKANPSNSYPVFWKFMEMVFAYAGTLSLEKELKDISVNEMQIGDVFIQGGSPGHAVIITDMAVNSKTGERIFMLAQSYMPAQEIQILQNPNDRYLSPWYKLDNKRQLITPEWIFEWNHLKRF